MSPPPLSPASTHPYSSDHFPKAHPHCTLNPPPTQTLRKPLSRQIDPWVWTSLVLSLTSLLFLRLINNNSSSLIKSGHAHTDGKSDDGAGRSGETALVGLGVRLGFEALLVVIVFYDTMLLILSTKEQQVSSMATQRMVVQSGLECKVSGGAACRCDDGADVDKGVDGDEEVVADEKRRSAVIWILAVSQSGLAAVGLYVAARLVLVLGGFTESETGHPVVECFEFIYALGEMGMMVYIAVCCLVQASARYGSRLRGLGRSGC